MVKELLKGAVASSFDATGSRAPRNWARIVSFGLLGAEILEYGKVRAQIAV